MGFFRSENSSKGLNVNNARRIKNQGLIVFDVIFFIVCLYVALLVGSTMNAYGDSNFISAAVKTISDVQTHTSYLLYMEFGPYTFTAIMWMFMAIRILLP